jgi:hypothetical protein
MATAKEPDIRKRSPLRRPLRALVVFTALPYLGIFVLLAVLQRSLIYGPTCDDALNVRAAKISGASVEPIQRGERAAHTHPFEPFVFVAGIGDR